MTVEEAKEAAIGDLLRCGFDPAIAYGCMVAGIICEDETGLALIAGRHPELCPRWRASVDLFRKHHPERVGLPYRSLDDVFSVLAAERDAGSWSANRDLSMMAIMRSLGLTFREVIQIRMEDVDLENQRIRVPFPEFETED